MSAETRTLCVAEILEEGPWAMSPGARPRPLRACGGKTRALRASRILWPRPRATRAACAALARSRGGGGPKARRRQISVKVRHLLNKRQVPVLY